eukprot:4090087-Amphidinium_carterae.1
MACGIIRRIGMSTHPGDQGIDIREQKESRRRRRHLVQASAAGTPPRHNALQNKQINQKDHTRRIKPTRLSKEFHRCSPCYRFLNVDMVRHFEL